MNRGWLKSAVAASIIVFTMASRTNCHADPAPVTSTYLKTFGSGFQYNRDRHEWTFFTWVVPLKKAPGGGPLYLVASFDNPTPHTAALIVKNDSTKTGKLGVELYTPPVSGMRDRKKYTVTVQAFADKADTNLLDTLRQAVVYHYIANPDAVMDGAKAHTPGVPYKL